MLFKDSDELKEYADVAASIKLYEVSNTITAIEHRIIRPILGKDLYDELCSAYKEDASQMSDEFKELLVYCRRVIGAFTCFHYIPKSAVQITSAGAQRTETDTNKTAYAYQVAAAQEQYLFEAEAAAEELSEYLYKNASEFDSYIESTEYKIYQNLFIKSGQDFERHFKTSSPYRNYILLRNKIEELEITAIKKAVTKEVFDTLKSRIKNNELNEYEEHLLLLIQKSLCYLAMAEAIPFLNVRVKGNEVTVISDTAGGVLDKEKRKMPDLPIISHYIQSCKDSGERWLSDAQAYLNDNAESFEYYKVIAPTEIVKKDSTSGGRRIRGIY